MADEEQKTTWSETARSAVVNAEAPNDRMAEAPARDAPAIAGQNAVRPCGRRASSAASAATAAPPRPAYERRSRRDGRRAHPSRPPNEIDLAARRLGIQRLYPEQERVIDAALAGRDVLVVLPTGFGKSACYQIPSMMLPKPVVLISPLLALLRDQHEKLLKRNIPCVRLDGTVRGKARREALERIAAAARCW